MYKKLILNSLILFSFYSLKSQTENIQLGKASFYAESFEGRKTTNGESYSQTKLTAAHTTLTFGTKVKVTNLTNNISVVVRINDRCSSLQGQIIKLSKAAATKLQFVEQEVTDVKIEVLDDNLDPFIKDNYIEKPIQTSTQALASEYYSFNSAKINPKGYGIQIGSFSEISNLLQITNNLTELFKAQTFIQVVNVNKIKVYRIILGGFQTKVEAEKIKDKITPHYPDSFIIEF